MDSGFTCTQKALLVELLCHHAVCCRQRLSARIQSSYRGDYERNRRRCGMNACIAFFASSDFTYRCSFFRDRYNLFMIYLCKNARAYIDIFEALEMAFNDYFIWNTYFLPRRRILCLAIASVGREHGKTRMVNP